MSSPIKPFSTFLEVPHALQDTPLPITAIIPSSTESSPASSPKTMAGAATTIDIQIRTPEGPLSPVEERREIPDPQTSQLHSSFAWTMAAIESSTQRSSVSINPLLLSAQEPSLSPLSPSTHAPTDWLAYYSGYRQVSLLSGEKSHGSPLQLTYSLSDGESSEKESTELKLIKTEAEPKGVLRLRPSASQANKSDHYHLSVPTHVSNVTSPPIPGRKLSVTLRYVEGSSSNIGRIESIHGNVEVRIGRPKIEFPSPPYDCVAILEKWRSKNQEAINEGVAKRERTSYEAHHIPNALKVFKRHHCTWSDLKHAFKETGFRYDPEVGVEGLTAPIVMQIMHDLRSAYNDHLISEVRNDFMEAAVKTPFSSNYLTLIANDFGSKTLGSDADIGFELLPVFHDPLTGMVFESTLTTSELHLKQVEAVKAFNMKFEAIWGHPSATIFDTNAYTMQYTHPANDPEIEQLHNEFQAECALLMRKKLHPEGWDRFTTDVLSKIANPEKKKETAERFKKINDRHERLENALLIKTLKVAICPVGSESSHPTASEVARWKAIVKSVSDEIGKNRSLKKQTETMVERIKTKNSDIDIWASNLLHEHFKQKCIRLEEIRIMICDAANKLKASNLDNKLKASNPDTFISTYNNFKAQIEKGFQKILSETEDPEVRAEISNLSNQLKNSVLVEKERTFAQKAFLTRTILQDRYRELTTDLRNMEAWRNLELEHRNLATLPDNPSITKKMVKIDEMRKKVERELSKSSSLLEYDRLLLSQFISKDGDQWAKHLDQSLHRQNSIKMREEDLANDFVTFYNAKVRQYEELMNEMKQFEDQADSISLKVKGLSLILDRLLYQVQYYNSQGLYFAQEPLITEGGFMVIVRGIQEGRMDPITFNQAVQASNECSGYHYNHQHAHGIAEDSYTKMIEVSKYTDRALVILNLINDRADQLGIPVPNLHGIFKGIKGAAPSEQLGNFAEFVKFAYSLRSNTALTAQQKQTQLEQKWVSIRTELGDVDNFSINSVNEIMDQLGSSIQAWYESVPEKYKNLVFIPIQSDSGLSKISPSKDTDEKKAFSDDKDTVTIISV